MVNKLYDLTKKSKSDITVVPQIIELFEPKIKKSILLTNYRERDELYQELKLKLVDVILNYDIDSTPGFWEMKKNFRKKDKKVVNNEI